MDVISWCGPLEVRLDLAANVTYGMFRAIVGTLTLYYRFLGIEPTLLRMYNISGRPCMRVTYNALAFFALKQLGNYCRFYTISFENPKTS